MTGAKKIDSIAKSKEKAYPRSVLVLTIAPFLSVRAIVPGLGPPRVLFPGLFVLLVLISLPFSFPLLTVLVRWRITLCRWLYFGRLSVSWRFGWLAR